MPDLIGLLRQRNTVQFATPLGVEQAELDLLGVLGKNREIYALAIPGSAERVRSSGPNNRFGVGKQCRTFTPGLSFLL